MPRRPQSNRPSTERKIYFYRAHVGLNPADLPLPFHPTPILRHIAALPFIQEGRYLSIGDDNSVCCGPNQDRVDCGLGRSAALDYRNWTSMGGFVHFQSRARLA